MDARLFEYLAGFVSGSRLKRFEDALSFRTRHITVVLEAFFQTQNASACLRSCECFGLQDVHVVERRNAFELRESWVLKRLGRKAELLIRRFQPHR